ncbi:MAG: hypothetical protein WDA06_00405 [Phenylobacterium sp.]
MIELTVALPLFRAKYIAWLALESLCLQKGVNFEWELVIAEETDSVYFPLNQEEVIKYEERLKSVGCTRIKYIPLKKWIPLAKKWKLIADNSSAESQTFILQPADGFSHPNRLKVANDLILSGADWVHSKIYVFYYLKNKSIYMLDRDHFILPSGKKHSCGIDMATRTEYAKKLPNEARKKGVDSWFYNNCRSFSIKKKSKFNPVWDKSDNWKYSLTVHGINNISNFENFFGKKGFNKSNINIKEFIPHYIIDRLDNEARTYALNWKRFVK